MTRKISEARVVKVVDSDTVVINRGSADGVREGMGFLVYVIEAEELKDPQTGESLGHLEIVRGTGKVVHVQDRISTVKSDKKRTRRYRQREMFLFNPSADEIEEVELPFDNPKEGDFAKPV